MGLESGAGIHIKTSHEGRRVDAARVRDEVVAYWTSKGARLLEGEHEEVWRRWLGRMERGAPAPYSDRLEVTIGSDREGWLTLRDSQESADVGLAAHLGRALDVPVLYFIFAEDEWAGDGDPPFTSVEQVFGPEDVAAGPVYHEPLRAASLGWHEAPWRSEPEEGVVVRFESLRAEDYRDGWSDAPTLRWMVLCRECEQVFLWTARDDVPVAADMLARGTAEALFELGYTRLAEPNAGSSRDVVLESVECPFCEAIRWIEIELRDAAFYTSRTVELTPELIELAHVISNDCVVEAAARSRTDPDGLSVRAALEILRAAHA